MDNNFIYFANVLLDSYLAERVLPEQPWFGAYHEIGSCCNAIVAVKAVVVASLRAVYVMASERTSSQTASLLQQIVCFWPAIYTVIVTRKMWFCLLLP